MITSIPRIHQMKSPRSGKAVANQFEIDTKEGTFFQSYSSIIAFVPKNRTAQTVLDMKYWDYSTTTAKYRNEFLCETTKETRKKIKEGVYLLMDLN